jgi:hypothetical protein
MTEKEKKKELQQLKEKCCKLYDEEMKAYCDYLVIANNISQTEAEEIARKEKHRDKLRRNKIKNYHYLPF